jgi:geranylgeranyl diphosphate synthase, type I
MRQSLPFLVGDRFPDQDQLRWALLPGLCCLGAGGRSNQADKVAAAWLLLYASAHIFDSIEDNDLPDPWWSEAGAGVAINVASGLIFTAFSCLQSLFEDESQNRIASTILNEFSTTLLLISSGQHNDLLEPTPGLADWMRIAESKSGSFFALACRAGARLATEEEEYLKGFSDFGNHLGIAIQILDDIGDFQAYHQGERPVLPEALNRSLAAAYVNEVGADKVKIRLQELISGIAKDPWAVQEVIRILDDCGAGLYLTTELERQRQFALRALERAAPKKAAGDKLAGMLYGLIED